MCMHMSPRAMRAACNRGRVEADFPNSSGALGRGRQREQQRQCVADLNVRTKHPFKYLVSFL